MWLFTVHLEIKRKYRDTAETEAFEAGRRAEGVRNLDFSKNVATFIAVIV